jgi:predicted RNA binding protein YcfA (HicA-like mRNA interferase family)
MGSAPQSGSHHILKHPDDAESRVVVPVHNQPLRRGTLADILQEAGMSAEELKEPL